MYIANRRKIIFLIIIIVLHPLHHMYAVGLDVDTSRVSFLTEMSVITIWLYAGNSLPFFVCPCYVDGKIKQSSFIQSRIILFIAMVFYVITIVVCICNIMYYTLKREGQSAGNPVKIDPRDIVSISDHMLKHKRPSNDSEIGYYLAGLIEGDGYIGKRGFEIVFCSEDVGTAYFIKKWIGYGSISRMKKKRAYKLSIFHKKACQKLWFLVNGKFQGPHKIAQAKEIQFDLKYNTPILPVDNTSILSTYWLAGFADADGNFSIFLSKSKTHKFGKNCTIPFRITQKHYELLIKVQEAFKGGILYQDTAKNGLLYRYSTTTFVRAVFVANYFDNFHIVNEYKWLRYTYWRKALLIIQNKEHLTENGLTKIQSLKDKMNKLQ